jgi:hypothetical protein
MPADNEVARIAVLSQGLCQPAKLPGGFGQQPVNA